MGIFKDESGNSYGDWTHRGQGRTRENANDIVSSGDEKKWYDQTFWIIFFLVIFWPVGLVLMWRRACTWHVAVKVVVTIVLLFMAMLSYQMSQAVLAAQGTLS
ncbi:holotricin-3 [Adlercreutzia sp. R25]|uniref:holotricin-3 n=1 Tax=Adlercreutzia shanghongiae TaxID=3111773 RepID=UPI002DBA1874|nr:holotricin-3 [Adlercreutzia sp. R25]MEC4273218.1 holotricin-3 [Adlercreutzia sp. R25]